MWGKLKHTFLMQLRLPSPADKNPIVNFGFPMKLENKVNNFFSVILCIARYPQEAACVPEMCTLKLKW